MSKDLSPKPQFPQGPINPNLLIIKHADENVKCDFCRTGEVNDFYLGPLYSGEGVVAHYYCVLFSSALKQKGKDTEGILGFLPEDIRSECRRGSKLKCAYCHAKGATIGCCQKKCKVSFHFPCGLKHKVNYQFLGIFESFCLNHSKRRIPPAEFSPEDSTCTICFNIFEKSEDNLIIGECCALAIFHKDCIQKLAITSGYFFKCPSCQREEKFVKDMKLQGIYVPEADALWERDPEAFSDLQYQYKHCDAEVCGCPKGRTYGAAKGNWLLARCRLCGSAGTHRLCGNLQTIANWECNPCKDVASRPPRPRPTEPRVNGEHAGVPKASAAVGPTPSTSTASSSSSAVASTSAAAAVVNGVVRSTPSLYRRRSENGSHPAAPKPTKNLAKRSTLSIHPTCYDYFPYTKAEINAFMKTNSRTVPDWEKKGLRVNLVPVFNSPGLVPESNPVPEAPAPPQNMMPPPPPPPPPPTKRATDKRSTGEKRQRKKSSWQRGVVKTRKNRGTAKATPTPSTGTTNGTTTQAEGQSSAENHGTALPHTSTKVLAGIHSAQQTFLRWAHTSPETRQERKEPPTNASAANAVPNPAEAPNAISSAVASTSTAIKRRTYAAVVKPLLLLDPSNCIGYTPPSNQRNETGRTTNGPTVQPLQTIKVRTSANNNDSTPIVIGMTIGDSIKLDHSNRARANEVDDDGTMSVMSTMSTAETEICHSESDNESVVVIGGRPAARRQVESDNESVVVVGGRPAARRQVESDNESVVVVGGRPAARRQVESDNESVVVVGGRPAQVRQEPGPSVSPSTEDLEFQRAAAGLSNYFKKHGKSREAQEKLRKLKEACPELFE